MAAGYHRIARLSSIKYGAGPTTVDGAIAAEWQHQASVAEGNSDADKGPTSIDLRGWSTTGRITVDNHASAVTLCDLATVTNLKFGYTIPGGSTKFVTFDNVNFGPMSELEYMAGDASGPTTRYQIEFDAVYGASDTGPADIVSYGDS